MSDPRHVVLSRWGRSRGPYGIPSGADDVRRSAQAVAAAVSGARYTTVEGEDHGVLHHPDVLVPLLRDFVS